MAGVSTNMAMGISSASDDMLFSWSVFTGCWQPIKAAASHVATKMLLDVFIVIRFYIVS